MNAIFFVRHVYNFVGSACLDIHILFAVWEKNVYIYKLWMKWDYVDMIELCPLDAENGALLFEGKAELLKQRL